MTRFQLARLWRRLWAWQDEARTNRHGFAALAPESVQSIRGALRTRAGLASKTSFSTLQQRSELVESQPAETPLLTEGEP